MKKAIQIGAGNIGRGFIGLLLEKAGYHVVFADVNEEIIGKINADKKYTVYVMDEVSDEISVSNISGVLSNSPAIIDEIATAQIITTAVGLMILPRIAGTIAQGIEKRQADENMQKLNIIACENAVNGSSALKESIYEKLSEEGKKFADEYVGFPNCSVDRIVPPVKCENIVDVVVENYYEWNVQSDGFCGEIPEINGMNLADNLMAYVERKLFTLNTGHAVCSYMGYLKGFTTVDESISNEEIYTIVKSAMTESGNGLIEKYGFDEETHAKYIDKIINRFRNKYLEDDVSRVGREPIRKLSPNDRLIKPMMTARSYGIETENLICGIGAALHYANDTDPQSVELQQKITEKGVAEAFAEISGVTDAEVLEKVVDAYNKLA